MMRWLFREWGVYLVSGIIILVSTAILALWWLMRRPATGPPAVAAATANAPKLAQIEGSVGSLILADNDLYDVATGELLAGNWLKHGMPLKIWWQAEAKTFLAQYERGLIRYNLDGTQDAELPNLPANTVNDDYKWAVWSKSGDIWRGEIDWQAMKLAEGRKITSAGQFNDQHFAAGIVFGTERTLIVRSRNKLLWVSMETGFTDTLKMSLDGISKRLSPNRKYVVGIEDGNFFCADVDVPETKTIKVGRMGMNDCQWLDNDRCVFIKSGRTVGFYEREKHILSEVCRLPEFCDTISEPSEDNRFVFTANAKALFLVDLTQKTAEQIVGQSAAWLTAKAFVISRDGPDSSSRGTWMTGPSKNEQRISPKPYLFGSSGALVKYIRSTKIVVFGAQREVLAVRLGEAESISATLRSNRVADLVQVQEWTH